MVVKSNTPNWQVYLSIGLKIGSNSFSSYLKNEYVTFCLPMEGLIKKIFMCAAS
jgi:hypothetical protein